MKTTALTDVDRNGNTPNLFVSLDGGNSSDKIESAKVELHMRACHSILVSRFDSAGLDLLCQKLHIRSKLTEKLSVIV